MSKPLNTVYASIIALLVLLFSGMPEAKLTSENSQGTPVISSLPRLLPLEQLIAETRAKYGNLIVRSARLTQQNKTSVYVIDFTNSKQQWMRTVYNAHTARLVGSASLKAPMAIEKSMALIYEKYPKQTFIRSGLERKNNDLVRVVELVDQNHKRREIVQDAYTGQVISEHLYNIKPSGKEISLEQVLKQVRDNRQGIVVLRTRSIIKRDTKVREIIYLDESHIKRKMTVNAITGEVLTDKITSGFEI